VTVTIQAPGAVGRFSDTAAARRAPVFNQPGGRFIMFSNKIFPVFAALLLTLAVSPAGTVFAAAGDNFSVDGVTYEVVPFVKTKKRNY
jgi:hypothetical protein